MLLFKGRPRKSPNLADTITPSQRRIMRLLGDAREQVQDSINLTELAADISHLPGNTIANRISVDPWINAQAAIADELYAEMVSAGQRVKLQPMRKTSYRGAHQAPRRGAGAPMHDLTGEGEYYPENVYGTDGARLYGSGTESELAPMEEEVIRIVRQIRGDPEAKVTVYRALPSNVENPTIVPGDWVTPSRAYAEMHGVSNLQGEYQVISVEANSSHLFTEANSLLEWGYDPPSRTVIPFRFDADRAQARAWADKEAGNLIVQISDEQREVVRDLIGRSQGGEFTVQQVARQIRGSIGLTNQQTGWVENFRQRQIDAAIERGVPSEQASGAVQGAVDKYHARIHRYRSETIARTETIRASSEGRQAAWQQGMDDGFISPFSRKRWIVEYDGCSICMNNGILGPIGVKDEFPTGEPPAHPNCRCDVILVDPDDEDNFDDLTDEELAAEIESLIEAGPAVPAPLPQSVAQGGLPQWAKDRGLEDLFAELPEDRSLIGYKTETEEERIRRWEQQESPFRGDSVESIRMNGEEGELFLDGTAQKLLEEAEAERRKILDDNFGLPPVGDNEAANRYRELDARVKDYASLIEQSRIDIERRDKLEDTLRRAREENPNWLESVGPPRIILDIDPFTGQPGETLKRHSEVITEVGEVVEDEVRRRLPPDVREAIGSGELFGVLSGNLTKDQMRDISRTRMEVLAEIRPMDEGQENFQPMNSNDAHRMSRRVGGRDVKPADDAAMTAINESLDVFPSEWISNMGQREGVNKVFTANRGFTVPGENVVGISGNDADSLRSVAAHEIGHRMESTTIGLKQLEYAYLWERTRLPELGLGNVSAIPGTRTMDDPIGERYLMKTNFREAYTTRMYLPDRNELIGMMRTSPREVPFEIFTTGTQATFPQVVDDLRYGDDDGAFQKWTLGLLASL